MAFGIRLLVLNLLLLLERPTASLRAAQRPKREDERARGQLGCQSVPYGSAWIPTTFSRASRDATTISSSVCGQPLSGLVGRQIFTRLLRRRELWRGRVSRSKRGNRSVCILFYSCAVCGCMFVFDSGF